MDFQDKEYTQTKGNLDIGRGCELCGCGTEEAYASVNEGCFKLHVTDWLKDYPDNSQNDIYEVRFKNTRRSYYRNVNGLQLKQGDIVAVEASPGHDIGIVSLTGDMVARQMRRVGFNPQNGEFKKIYRKAKPYDIEKWQEAIALEHGTMIKARQIAADMNLNMKIGDVEYQGDKIKAIFYYIADERVDFRELIKVFAEVFHIRVEMKQIGARQEAGRIGGIGSCGRELCCASWISSFMSVTTNAARTQDISLNPQKLAGQCSKLKCCLVYEYDDYMDARREFPRVTAPLQTMDADYHLVKNDILARTMSFSTDPNSMAGLVTVPVQRVIEVMKLNARGVKPERLEGKEGVSRVESEPGFVNVIGEDSITRFDNAGRKGRGSRRDKERRNGAEQVARDGRQTAKSKNSNVSQAVAENTEQPRENGAERQEAGNRRRDDRRRNGDARKGDRQRQEGEQRQQRGPQEVSRGGADAPKRQRAEQPAQEGQERGGQERGERRERPERRDQQRRRENGQRGEQNGENRQEGQQREQREGRENGQPRDNREPREPRDNGQQREPREGRENGQPRDNREPREPRDNGQQREPREGRENGQPREQRNNRQRGGRNGGNRREGQERRQNEQGNRPAQAPKKEE